MLSGGYEYKPRDQLDEFVDTLHRWNVVQTTALSCCQCKHEGLQFRVRLHRRGIPIIEPNIAIYVGPNGIPNGDHIVPIGVHRQYPTIVQAAGCQGGPRVGVFE